MMSWWWFVLWFCKWIVFINSVFQVPPQKTVRRVEILGIGWPGVIGLTWNESVPSEVMPEVLKCSVQVFISRQNNNPWPSYPQDLNPPDCFLRVYLKDRVCENNLKTREDIMRREIKWIPQEMLNSIVDSFNVRVAAVLSCSSSVHGTNIVLITKKI